MVIRKNFQSRKIRKKRFSPSKSNSVSDSRLASVFIILCLGISCLMGRLAWLQVFQYSVLQARARASQTYRTLPLGKRLSIVDREGKLVALDEEKFRLWAHPRYFNFPGDDSTLRRTPLEVSRQLSSLLPMSTSEIADKLSVSSSGIRLAEGLEADTASSIRKLGISGLDIEPYLQRNYPQGNLFANVVGFLNQERVPQAGLEQSLNSQLIIKEKTRIFRRSADGTPLPDDLPSGSFSGKENLLYLTLDARLQKIAVKALVETIKNWQAKKGVAIVMDVSNGELLALASTPSYDPNNYWKYPPALFREWSVQDLFEPGSTFKPINLALALQEEIIKPSGIINDTGKINVGGWSIYNHDRRANGLIDFPKVLQVSSNVGMVKVMSKLQPSLYWEWLRRLGIDSKPNTDLPGAVAGQLKSKKDFIQKPIESAAASYGQGFSLTPLKLAQLHAMIANGGHLVSPRITRDFIASEHISQASNLENVQIFRPEVTRIVNNWMESVVNQGSGLGVKTPGYRIAGKTGTAQKADNGSYIPGAKICSFVASLPVEDPRYVVLVVVDEPKGKNAYGSTVAVPVAKKIIDGLLVLKRIPPNVSDIELKPAKG